MLLSWCMLHAQNVSSSLLNCNLLNNYIHQLFNFLHPKASVLYSADIQKKYVMNKWTNFREKSPLLIWCSKNEGLLEILIHARASRFPWIPWRIEKCKSSVTPVTSYLPSSPPQTPGESVIPAALIPGSGMCLSWTRCFTFQGRADLPCMKELELKQGDYVTQISQMARLTKKRTSHVPESWSRSGQNRLISIAAKTKATSGHDARGVM